MGRYVLALDQGTTSSRALLVDGDQRVVGMRREEFLQLYPQAGWVEHDPMEIYASQYSAAVELIVQRNIDPRDIAAIGIANQRETAVVWERDSGAPLYNAIVWQCRRTADIVDRFVREGWGEYTKTITGLVPDAYFSASKIQWILDRVDRTRERSRRGEIRVGTIDSWLIWKLTGGASHKTDYTNAARTMLFDIHKLDWDDKLLDYFDIPREALPEVCPSSHIFGEANIMGVSVPIAAAAGDQQAALFGQRCFDNGDAKNTYGTGCFLLTHTGGVSVESQNGLLTTLAASLPGRVEYALEGSVFVGGAVVQWLRDELGLIEKSSDMESAAIEAGDNGGAYLVPAFTGLGAPHWDMYARGCLVGLTRGVNRLHIIRAAEESIAYQTLDLIRAMEKDTGVPIASLRADGGASGDSFLMQFQADIMNGVIQRPEVRESTALGAALLAGIAVGLWGGLEDARSLWRCEREFTPRMKNDQREALLAGWRKAVERARDWA